MSAGSPLPPIAVVGASALFPGSRDAFGFWRDILAGRDLITEVPETHWRAEDYYDPDPARPDRAYCKRGGFLSAHPFDCRRYGLPPNLLTSTDTGQLLALCLAEAVLEDAARGPWEKLDRSRCSVILGATGTSELVVHMGARLQHPIWLRALAKRGIAGPEAEAIVADILDHYAPWTEATFPGLLGNVVAGRIANRFDLGGTNCVVDAACASSHSALSMGLMELASGQSDLVITGGVDTLNDVLMYMCFSKTPALSPTGDCRPFSDRADGTVLGEGLAMLALRRLDDAERSGDRVYAVIRGMGSSSDGRATSVYAPRPEGQAVALRRAYESAGYSPATVELMEAHGTGTKAGDKAELAGLALVFGEGADQPRPWCAIGSIKSMVGHTKGAAGAASLFKVVMALHNRVLPPTIKVERPRPELAGGSTPFYVNTRSRPWVRDGSHPRRASVSAFGFGGSNFHATVEEYRGPLRHDRFRPSPAELVLLSASSRAELRVRIQSCLDTAARKSLQQIAAEAAALADPGCRVRLAVCAGDTPSLHASLREVLAGLDRSPAEATGSRSSWWFGDGMQPGRIAFLFPGQGSQRVGMGGDLAMAFTQALDAWDEARVLDPLGGAPDRAVFPPPAFEDSARNGQEAFLRNTDQAQPALAAASVATLRVLRMLGLDADVFGGHSFGELTALMAAGAFDARTLYRLARARGLAMTATAGEEPGGMAAVAAPYAAVAPVIERFHPRVVVANRNAPAQQVLAGESAVLAEAVEALGALGMHARALPVAAAFHSPRMAGAGAAFLRNLAETPMSPPGAPVYAARTASLWPPDPVGLREGLARQLEEPVLFQETIEAMHREGVRTFVEVGPGAVLTGLVSRILEGRPHRAIATDRANRPGIETLFAALGQLWACGAGFQPAALWEGVRPEPGPPPEPDGRTIVPVLGINYGKAYPARWSESAAPVAAPRLPAPTPPPSAPPTRTGTPPAAAGPRPPSATAAEAPAIPMQTPPPAPAAPRPPLHAATQAAASEAFAALQSLQDATARAHEAFLSVARQSLEVMQNLLGPAPAAPLTAAAAAPPHSGSARPGETRTAAPPRAVSPPPPATAPVATANRTAPEPAPASASPEASAPRPAAPPSPVPSPALAASLRAIVAEKTGYPEESIDPSMDLEADLGIDSIKRVEILSAVQERFPQLPAPDAALAGAARTLREVLALFPGASSPPASGDPQVPAVPAVPASKPSAPAPAAPDAGRSGDLPALLRSIVAEKTGYPEESIDPSMDLEADLGIDSIKRVEILSALSQTLPHLPEPDAAAAGSARTLREVLALFPVQHPAANALNGNPAPVEPPAGLPPLRTEAASSAAAPSNLVPLLKRIVAEKTGYPEDAIDPSMDLEADLGIDSIKRVEILSALNQALPHLPEPDPAQAAAARTLAEVEALLGGATGVAATPALASKTRQAQESAPPRAPGPPLVRSVVRYGEAAAPGFAPLWIAGGETVVVISEPGEVARHLARHLEAAGARVEIRERARAGDRNLIFLRGFGEHVATEAALEQPLDLLADLQVFGADKPRWMAAILSTGFALPDGGLSGPAFTAGKAALLKVAAAEWPGTLVRSIDMATGGAGAEDVGAALAREILAGEGEPEVRIGEKGRRLAVCLSVEPEIRRSETLEGPVAALGGARGVTSKTLLALAEERPLPVALLGRTGAEPDPPWAEGVEDGGLRAAAAKAEAHRGETPRQLEARVRAVLAAREVRATIAALKERGCEVLALSCDARNRESLSRAIQTVTERLGRPRTYLHGAGVLADQFIERKDRASWDRVVGTKVDPLLHLMDLAAPESRLLLFGSIAGRAGNAGQADYAVANATLARAGEALSASGRMQARTVDWGPWDGGMVTETLRKMFLERGIPVIPGDEGARQGAREIAAAASSPACEVVFGPAPDRLCVPCTRTVVVSVDACESPYLNDHRIGGETVVPLVLVQEWFLRALRSAHPSRKCAALADFQVLRGVVLPEDGTAHFAIRWGPGEDGGAVKIELLDAEGNRRFSARVVEPEDRTDGVPVSAGPPPGEIPGHWLFHGPSFQGLQEVISMDSDGAAARSVGLLSKGWPAEGWASDPLLLDAGLQLARIWGWRELDVPTLPTRVARIEVVEPGPNTGVATVSFQGRRRPSGISGDLVFTGEDGRTIARLLGIEMYKSSEAAADPHAVRS